MCERHRYKKENPEEGHHDGEGAGAHNIREETEKVRPLV